MMLAAYISTASVIGSAGALYLLRLNTVNAGSVVQDSGQAACIMFSLALCILATAFNNESLTLLGLTGAK